MIRTGLIALLSLAAHPAAGDISLAFPVDCALGQNCYFQYTMDHDPSDGIRDYQCGALTYDGHSGTDVALNSINEMEAGVAVLAAAAGRVLRTRDGTPDIMQVDTPSQDVLNKKCGNGIVLDHGQGYETQYCHLMEGSVSVRPGDQVVKGQDIGKIGLSGFTNFPHLDFTLRKNGSEIDPFDIKDPETCDDPLETVWKEHLQAKPAGLIAVGIHDGVPDYAEIKQGTAHFDLPPDADAMVAWAYSFMGRRGDILKIVVLGPGGIGFNHSEALEKDQPLQFRAYGLRRKIASWPKGLYTVVVELSRGGEVLDFKVNLFDID